MSTSHSQKAELELVARDVEDVIRLTRAMETHESGALYPFSTVGLIALVAKEGHRLLDSDRPVAGEGANKGSDDDARITQARARLKLFDDTKGGEPGLVRLLEAASRKVSAWSNANHRGPLRAWKRLVQPDLGTYWLGQQLVATTHTALLSIGMTATDVASWTLKERDSVGPTLRAYAHYLGTRIGALAALLNERDVAVATDAPAPEPPPRPMTFNDFSSKRFYAAVTSTLQPVEKRHTRPLVMAMCQINSAAWLLPALLERDSNLLLRAQTLAAYHGSRTIAQAAPRAMLPLEDPESANHPLKIPRDVRNLCAHYGLRGAGRHVRAGDDDPFGSALEGLTGLDRPTFQDGIQLWLRNLSDAAGAQLKKDDFVRHRAPFGKHT